MYQGSISDDCSLITGNWTMMSMWSGSFRMTRAEEQKAQGPDCDSQRNRRLMSLHIILGGILFVLGAIQLLPVIRRRAAERGLSGGVAIPFILACIGFTVFMIGVWGLNLG
jgi:hypothetical protein